MRSTILFAAIRIVEALCGGTGARLTQRRHRQGIQEPPFTLLAFCVRREKALIVSGCDFSPFTGASAEGPDGPNKKDPSLLFIHHGNAGEYGYVSQRLQGAVRQEVREMEPAEIAARLSLPAAVVLEVDTGWNGVKLLRLCPRLITRGVSGVNERDGTRATYSSI